MRITTSKALTTARQANAAKSRFLSSLSHDIRTPMNSIKKIRESGIANAKSINIIAMTGNAFSSDIKASIKAGMNYHLSKPINMKELEDVVTSLITNKLLTSHP